MFSFHFLVISVYDLQKLAKNFKWQSSATIEEYAKKTDVQNFFKIKYPVGRVGLWVRELFRVRAQCSVFSVAVVTQERLP